MRRSRSPKRSRPLRPRSKSPRVGGLAIVYERRRGSIVGVQVRGHAGFAQAAQDIVCAAASALVLSAAQGLRDYCHVTPQISDTAAAYILRLPGGGNARAQAVLATTVAGLQAIAASYPGYLTIGQLATAAGARATGPRPRRAKPKSTRVR